MEKKVNVGLIGYGTWTQEAYLPALHRDGRSKIISAAVRSRETKEKIRTDFGPDIQIYDRIEDLLSAPELDAVMIAVPDAMHEYTLLKALDSNAAVFYEPPVADRRERLIPVMKHLLTARNITFADLELRFIPAVTRSARLIEQGTLGALQTARIRLQSGWGPVPDYDLCNLNHMCPWYVDVLNHVLGSTPKRVMLFDGHGTPGRRQSHCIGHFDYDGILGIVQANITSVGDLDIGLEINGDDGDLIVNLLEGNLRYRTRENPEWSVEYWPSILPHASWPGMHESVTAFLDAVEAGVATVNSAEHFAKLLLIGLAAEMSKENGKWEEIKDLSVFGVCPGRKPTEL